MYNHWGGHGMYPQIFCQRWTCCPGSWECCRQRIFSCHFLQELPCYRELPHIRLQLLWDDPRPMTDKSGSIKAWPFLPDAGQLLSAILDPELPRASAKVVFRLHHSSTSLSAKILPPFLLTTSMNPKGTHLINIQHTNSVAVSKQQQWWNCKKIEEWGVDDILWKFLMSFLGKEREENMVCVQVCTRVCVWQVGGWRP